MTEIDCLLIGIDGLDPELLTEWKEDLPAFSALSEQGSFGRLSSTYPPLSSPAWPSINTGKQGGKHGVFSFSKNSQDARAQVPLNYDDIQAETLWEACGRADLSAGVVNVPMTYPPSEPENGYLISGWPAPARGDIASPSSVLSTVEEQLGERYRVNPFPVGPERSQMTNAEILDVMTEALWHHHRAFEILLDEFEVDLFYCMYDPIDPASHHLARDQSKLKQLYEAQDQALEELIDSVDNDPNIVLISDHGHCARGDLAFKTNEWLAEQGLLSREQSSQIDQQSLFRDLGLTRKNLLKVKRKLGVGHIRSRLPQPVIDGLAAVIPPEDENTGFPSEQIDLEETQAFSSMQNLIYLNDERYHGVVTGTEKEELRQEIKEKLLALDYPDSDGDRSLMTYVYSKEEIFEGPYLEEAPDLVFVADEMRCACHTGFDDGNVFTDHEWGEHKRYAVCITAGPQFSAEDDVRERSVMDVFPLVGAALDMPVPLNLDGELPDERFVTQPELETRRSDDVRSDSTDFTSEEVSEIEEQLEGLGYLE